jgi:hypothetical protein
MKNLRIILDYGREIAYKGQCEKRLDHHEHSLYGWVVRKDRPAVASQTRPSSFSPRQASNLPGVFLFVTQKPSCGTELYTGEAHNHLGKSLQPRKGTPDRTEPKRSHGMATNRESGGSWESGNKIQCGLRDTAALAREHDPRPYVTWTVGSIRLLFGPDTPLPNDCPVGSPRALPVETPGLRTEVTGDIRLALIFTIHIHQDLDRSETF